MVLGNFWDSDELWEELINAYSLWHEILLQSIIWNKKQAWILAPDIGQCPTKNRVMSNEGWFTMDTIVRLEVKKLFYELPTS